MTGCSWVLRGQVDPLPLLEQLMPQGVTTVHRFEPQGTSAVRIGARGTIALHTWPERDLVTLDLYGAASARRETLASQLSGLVVLSEDPWN